MRGAENAILELFRQDQLAALSTTEIVRAITPGFERIEQDLNSSDVELSKKARYAKASLHRKVLYHLNKLLRKGVLAVKTIGENKEKVFVLASTPAVPKHTTQLPPSIPAIPTEGLEQEKIICRFEPFAWADRLNAFLLETNSFGSRADISHAVSTAFNSVNDSICLNDFEGFLQKHDVGTNTAFLKSLNQKCDDYGKKITLTIDLTNLSSPELVLGVIKNFLGLKTKKHLVFVYELFPREFHDHKEFFENLINEYSKTGESLYFKNENVHNAPYIIGRAGPYTFSDSSWNDYKKNLQGQVQGLVCAQSTILVDAHKYFREHPKTVASLSSLMLKVAKSLRVANEHQRKRSNEFFKGLSKSESMTKHLFRFSTNYVRFWNYGWKTPKADFDFVLQALQESKKAVDDYCASEETIYLSCGMPTRFKTVFSCAFEECVKDIFSKPLFSRHALSSRNDYDKQEFKEVIRTKEKVLRVFEGGDSITFYRVGQASAEEVANEVSHVLTGYRLPFFRFKFNAPKTKGMQTLIKYLEGIT